MPVTVTLRVLDACTLDVAIRLRKQKDDITQRQGSTLGQLMTLLVDVRWRKTTYVHGLYLKKSDSSSPRLSLCDNLNDDVCPMVGTGDVVELANEECKRIAKLALAAGLQDMSASWSGCEDGSVLVSEVDDSLPDVD